jgi:hypothetical protein
MTFRQNRDTGMAIVLILLLVTWIGKFQIFVLPAIIILIVTMTIPKLLNPISIFWFGFSEILGTFVSKILLSVIFYIIVVPVAFIRKIFGSDSLALNQWKKSQDSVFKDRAHKFISDDFDKPY